MSLSLREKHAEATRRALLDAACKLFVSKGYDNAGVDEIAAEAGATRGAVYHHFKGKQDLLLALLNELQAELVREVVSATKDEPDPLRRMESGIGAFLDACESPRIRQIVFRDGPAVLGWEVWREIDARHFLGVTAAGMRELIDRGIVQRFDPELLAHLFMAMMTEGVLMIERAADPAATRAQVETALRALLGGVRKV